MDPLPLDCQTTGTELDSPKYHRATQCSPGGNSCEGKIEKLEMEDLESEEDVFTPSLQTKDSTPPLKARPMRRASTPLSPPPLQSTKAHTQICPRPRQHSHPKAPVA